MPHYHYQAQDASGRKVEGEIEAADLHAAREVVASRGLLAAELVVVEPRVRGPNEIPSRLAPSDAEEMLGHVAQVSMSLAPLTDGLRAAATETTNHRVAAALR
jgi:type II secretory pathway component PulF